MQVEVLSTDELGDRSYVVHAGRTPSSSTRSVTSTGSRPSLAGLGVRVALVVETHIHNDYVTGGLELARRTGARYAVNAADPSSFDRTPWRDGDELRPARLRVTRIATPGPHRHPPRLRRSPRPPIRPHRLRSSPADRCSTAASGEPTWSTRTGRSS